MSRRLSLEILASSFALRLSRTALSFPAVPKSVPGKLCQAQGNMLRHAYRTVAADLGVDDLLIRFLMGHTPRGISRKYVAVLILANGAAMRAAQERISVRIPRVRRGKPSGQHQKAAGAPCGQSHFGYQVSRDSCG